MIQVTDVTKTFGQIRALDGLSCEIPKGSVYGLVGSNGAGKSTLLRLIGGVYRPDKGGVSVDGAPVFNNPAAKAGIVYVPDEMYFLPNANLRRMAELYSGVYPDFDGMRLRDLQLLFQLDMGRPLHTFSKGMRRQAALILALSCKTQYILLDETFDGLDPAMRNLAKKVIYSDVSQRDATALITSHSLRELEDTCDQLALLHEGRLILQSEIGHIKTSICKIQVALEALDAAQDPFAGLEVVKHTRVGSVHTLIVRGAKEAVLGGLAALHPLLLEAIPLTLDEIFIYELEALGYAPQARLDVEAVHEAAIQ